MPSKANWSRSYKAEDEEKYIKYVWRNTSRDSYEIVIIDLKKELGSFHPDYSRNSRYEVTIVMPENEIPLYFPTIDEAFNYAVDIQEIYTKPERIPASKEELPPK